MRLYFHFSYSVCLGLLFMSSLYQFLLHNGNVHSELKERRKLSILPSMCWHSYGLEACCDKRGCNFPCHLLTYHASPALFRSPNRQPFLFPSYLSKTTMGVIYLLYGFLNFQKMLFFLEEKAVGDLNKTLAHDITWVYVN